MKRLDWLLLTGAALAVLSYVATSGSPPSKPDPVAPASAWVPLPNAIAATGRAAVVDNERLWLSEADGAFRSAAAALPGGYLQDPAWRPGGGSVAYTRVTPGDDPSAGSAATGSRFTADIWDVESNGTAHVLVEHGAPDVRLSKPTWTKDGSAIVFVRGGFVRQSGVESLSRQIQQQVLSTGERTILVDNADWPALSPDGTLLAFVRLSAVGRSELWVRESATGVERQLTHGEFASITSPQFSSTGQTIAFGGALYVPKRGVADAIPLIGQLGAWLVPVAEAHELLEGVWLIPVDGSQLHRVGELALDGVTVRWASDAGYVLIWDEDGLYRANVFTSERALLLRPGSYRGFDWLSTT